MMRSLSGTELKRRLKAAKRAADAPLLRAWLAWTRLRASTGRIERIKDSVLVVPATGPGGLGDDAMLTATVDHLAARGMRHIGVVSYFAAREWAQVAAATHHLDLAGYFRRASLRDTLRFVAAAARHERVYFLGADVMDGYHSDENTVLRLGLVTLAARLGCDCRVLGFSLNERPTPAAVRAWRKVPATVRLCARDRISQERLLRLLGRRSELVADVAFLLAPDTAAASARATIDWIARQRAAGRTVVGINANCKLLPREREQPVAHLIGLFAAALEELQAAAPELAFVLIPHDSREFAGEPSDVAVARAIREALPPALQALSFCVPLPCRAAEIKGICGALDFVFTGRMHIAIACLGMGTPAACITYQDKFEGLFEHFGIAGMTIDPQQAVGSGKLSRFLLPLLRRREDIRRAVLARLPEVQRLSQANFHGGLPAPGARAAGSLRLGQAL